MTASDQRVAACVHGLQWVSSSLSKHEQIATASPERQRIKPGWRHILRRGTICCTPGRKEESRIFPSTHASHRLQTPKMNLRWRPRSRKNAIAFRHSRFSHFFRLALRQAGSLVPSPSARVTVNKSGGEWRGDPSRGELCLQMSGEQMKNRIFVRLSEAISELRRIKAWGEVNSVVLTIILNRATSVFPVAMQ